MIDESPLLTINHENQVDKTYQFNELVVQPIEIFDIPTKSITDERWYNFSTGMKLSKYSVSNKGRLWSKFYFKIIQGTLSPHGYMTTSLSYDDGKYRSTSLHRLVALTLIPNPQNKKTVDHIDRNRTNNVVENLRWATTLEQCQYRTKAKTIGGRRRVDQFTLEGKYVKTWDSVGIAGQSMGGSKNLGQSISNSCNSTKKTAYGYFWRYTPIVDLVDEVWKPIPDIDDYYASSKGRIKRGTGYGAELFEGAINGQYRTVCVQHHSYQVHVLICSTFNGIKPTGKHEVNHINGDTIDNQSSNLEWLCHSDNVKHAFKNGLINRQKTKQHKVNKYSMLGEFICEYPSIRTE